MHVLRVDAEVQDVLLGEAVVAGPPSRMFSGSGRPAILSVAFARRRGPWSCLCPCRIFDLHGLGSDPVGPAATGAQFVLAGCLASGCRSSPSPGSGSGSD